MPAKKTTDDKKKKTFNPRYVIHGDVDTIIEEKGDMFTSIRKVQWLKDSEHGSDPSKAKVEIRKWRVTPEGEIPNKGITFMTDEGPHNCVLGLIENGYGHTKDILLKLKDRDDFRHAVETMYDDTDMSDTNGEYFDARELLLNE